MSGPLDPAAEPPPTPRHGREEYSFACMHCGYGWEQAYEIRHHTDLDGRPFVTWHDPAGGRRVPSPLTRPVCPNCESHVVRIMRPGWVYAAEHALPRE
ncbi:MULTISPECIES: hypothetical protein [Streptomyces]|uniref:C2H2-type domain-containing protein n=1 Tax=Streptomyces desertarenae TaxID=2666184 RepID=A0ABW4PGX7_9ACTN